MKIYTKSGDSGDTSLAGGKRVRKNDVRVELYGTLDELNAVLGFSAASLGSNCEDLKNEIIKIQSLLFRMGSILADPEQSGQSAADEKDIQHLEDRIDIHTETLDPLKNFILPGGCETAARLHVARTISRRMERRMTAADSLCGRNDAVYMNRLSDYLFTAARTANKRNSYPEIIWKKD